MSDQSDKDYTVPALARGLNILAMFHDQQRVLSMNDMAEKLEVSNSSLYRIVQTLSDMGYLRKIARNTFELGPAVVTLGFSYLATRDIIDMAAPHLKQLRDATSVSCHLSIRDGRDTLYLYRALASQRLSVNVPAGSRLPCHVNAMGRILLSGLSDDELGRLYLGVQLDSYPKPYPQSLPELRRRIEAERVQGFAVNRSDHATAIAAPILNHANEVIAAINASGPDSFMQGEPANQEVVSQLLATAKAISEEAGYRTNRR